MHTMRKEKGELSAQDYSKYWMQTQKAMFGNSVELTDDYGIWWSYIPHFLNTPGYVYSYAFGELLVLALYSLYQKEGDAFVDKYIDLLSAGGSKSPYELVAPFNIDLDAETFWHGGLDIVASLVAQLETL